MTQHSDQNPPTQTPLDVFNREELEAFTTAVTAVQARHEPDQFDRAWHLLGTLTKHRLNQGDQPTTAKEDHS